MSVKNNFYIFFLFFSQYKNMPNSSYSLVAFFLFFECQEQKHIPKINLFARSFLRATRKSLKISIQNRAKNTILQQFNFVRKYFQNYA